MRHYNLLGNAAEFAMFDAKVSKALYDSAKTDAKEILSHMETITKYAKIGRVPISGLDSWKPGLQSTNLSSQISA